MQIETSQEIRPIHVYLGEDKDIYEFKHAIIHGVENKDDGKLMSLICGYSDINDFIMVYTNILVECYHFLEENYEDGEDFNVLNVLKNYTNDIFERLERGDFKDSEEAVSETL